MIADWTTDEQPSRLGRYGQWLTDLERCPGCGKRTYPTAERAKIAAVRLAARYKKRHDPYRCTANYWKPPWGPPWHLTQKRQPTGNPPTPPLTPEQRTARNARQRRQYKANLRARRAAERQTPTEGLT